MIVLIPSFSLASGIYNPGNGQSSCTSGGATGFVMTDSANCTYCATISGGSITTTLIQCPGVLAEDATTMLMEDNTRILVES